MIVWPPSPASSRAAAACGPGNLYNCNECPAKPVSAWPYMSQLGPEIPERGIRFCLPQQPVQHEPILKASEIDDSRPTVIRVMSEEHAI